MKIKDNMKACDSKTDRKAAVYIRKPKIFIKILCDNLYKKRQSNFALPQFLRLP
jgi:hypothetical protein